MKWGPYNHIEQAAQNPRLSLLELSPEFILGAPSSAGNRRQMQEHTAVGQITLAHDFVDTIHDNRPLAIKEISFLVGIERPLGDPASARQPAETTESLPESTPRLS